MQNTVLRVDRLTKKYTKITAVDNLSFKVPKGSIYGILGPNGSGKTTTLGIILSVINSNSGTYNWFGQNEKINVRRRVGTLLETPNFFPYLSAERNLEIVAEIKKVDYQHIDTVLKTVELYHRKKHKFKTFSLGMKQRLAVAAALLGEPEVLILDEPTNGLDPQGIVDTRELIKKTAKQGKTVILASHLLDEVHKICTDVLVLKKGKKLFEGKVHDLTKENNTIEINLDYDVEKKRLLIEFLQRSDYTKKIMQHNENIILETNRRMSTQEVNEDLFKNGFIVSYINYRKQNFENQILTFMNEKK